MAILKGWRGSKHFKPWILFQNWFWKEFFSSFETRELQGKRPSFPLFAQIKEVSMGDNNILQQQTSSNNWIYYDLFMFFSRKGMAYRNWWRSCQDEVFSCENLFFVWAIRPWVVLLFVKQWYQGLKMWNISPNISFASKISFAKPFHTGLAKISAQHEHFPLVVCLNLAWPREATEWYQFSWWTRPFSDCRDPQILISIRCALHLPIFHPFGPRIEA